MPDKKSLYDKAVENAPIVAEFLPKFSEKDRKRLLLQAGSHLIANENLDAFYTLQSLSSLSNEEDFKRGFHELVAKIRQGELNFESETTNLIKPYKEETYTREFANRVIGEIEREIVTNLREFFRVVNTNTIPEAQANALKEKEHVAQNNAGANLYLLEKLMKKMAIILPAIATGMEGPILSVLETSKVSELPLASRRQLFEMITRELLMNNDPNINLFLKIAMNALRDDERTLNDFVQHVANDLRYIPKNDATSKAVNYLVQTRLPSEKDNLIEKLPDHYTLEEAKKELQAYVETLRSEITARPISDQDKKKPLQAIDEAIKKLNAANDTSYTTTGAYLKELYTNIVKPAEMERQKLAEVEKSKAYLLEYAKRLETSYLYQKVEKRSFTQSGKEKNHKKSELRTLIREIRGLEEQGKLTLDLVPKYLEDLEKGAKSVKETSKDRHHGQVGHRLFSQFKKTESLLPKSSKTEQAIDKAEKEAKASVSITPRR